MTLSPPIKQRNTGSKWTPQIVLVTVSHSSAVAPRATGGIAPAHIQVSEFHSAACVCKAQSFMIILKILALRCREVRAHVSRSRRTIGNPPRRLRPFDARVEIADGSPERRAERHPKRGQYGG